MQQPSKCLTKKSILKTVGNFAHLSPTPAHSAVRRKLPNSQFLCWDRRKRLELVYNVLVWLWKAWDTDYCYIWFREQDSGIVQISDCRLLKQWQVPQHTSIAGMKPTHGHLKKRNYIEKTTIVYVRPWEEAGVKFLSKFRYLNVAIYTRKLGKSTCTAPGNRKPQIMS